MPSILVFFRKEDCNSFSTRSLCTRARGGPRGLKLRPGTQHEALQAARDRFMSAEQDQLEYRLRAGGEMNEGSTPTPRPVEFILILGVWGRG